MPQSRQAARPTTDSTKRFSLIIFSSSIYLSELHDHRTSAFYPRYRYSLQFRYHLFSFVGITIFHDCFLLQRRHHHAVFLHQECVEVTVDAEVEKAEEDQSENEEL